MNASRRHRPADPERSKATKTGNSGIYIYCYRNTRYRVDTKGFLLFRQDWDENFAEGKAPSVGISGGLTERHWRVIWFVRNNFDRINQCPVVYVACKENNLGLGELRELFPKGYLRGVCKLAGVTYREAYVQHLYLEENDRRIVYTYNSKTYSIDVRGFLVDSSEWDENFALHKAYEIKAPKYLTDRHFAIIHYLRERFAGEHEVPSIIEVCEDLDTDLTELDRLFPDGYVGSAVKIAGLRLEPIVHETSRFDSGALCAAGSYEKGDSMDCKDKTYPVDTNGFLVNFDSWDKDFAEATAREIKIPGGLTQEHWDVLNHIRDTFNETGKCPLVYETCRMCGLSRRELKRLFPTGYLRGACKMAGITYREGYLGQAELPTTAEDLNLISMKKTYKVDVRGFLIDPSDWDEYYAAFRAHDMKIPGGKLTDDHWCVINFLRASFAKKKEVPTVYETCEANKIDLDELERLFPDGYHRGAVKVAGLRVR